MKKKNAMTLLCLIGWTVFLGGIYLALAETPYTMFVSMVYAVAGTVLFVFFLLVNGGARSLPSVEERRALAAEEKKDNGKGDAKRDKAHDPPSRPDLFHLGAEKQDKVARLLLILAAPFFFVLAADYIYLHFFWKD